MRTGRPPIEREPRSHMLRVRITPTMFQALQSVATEDGASESEVVRRLIADEIRRRQGRKGKR